MSEIRLGELSFETLASIVEETLKKGTADKEELKVLLHEALLRARKYRQYTSFLLGKLGGVYDSLDRNLTSCEADKGRLKGIVDEFYTLIDYWQMSADLKSLCKRLEDG